MALALGQFGPVPLVVALQALELGLVVLQELEDALVGGVLLALLVLQRVEDCAERLQVQRVADQLVLD